MIFFMRCFRVIIFPLLRYVFPLFSKKLKARIDFEFKNWTHVPALSKAEYGFEISSEGELEQTKVLIMEVLSAGKTVELIFCSPSVESQCQELIETYPNQIRIYRLPIITYNPFSKMNNPVKWMTCETLFMCRYDFFPELIHYGMNKAKNFYLIAGSLKNYSSKNYLVKKYLKACYLEFHKVVCVTEQDKASFHNILRIEPEKLLIYDFRVLQILSRLENQRGNIEARSPNLSPLLDYLQETNSKKIVFGSYWKQEFPIFKKSLQQTLRENAQIFIAPHELDEKNLDAMIKDFENMEVPIYSIGKESTQNDILNFIKCSKENPGVWILGVKGILCEFYTYFDLAYVGGGFGVSIHSVLEPYMAGAVVFCGPKVHRSTEYSLIKENNPDRLYKITKKNLILDQMNEVDLTRVSSHDTFKNNYLKNKQSVFKWLGVSE